MTASPAPRLTAPAVSAVVRRAIGAGNAKVSTGRQIETDGALVAVEVTVSIHGAKRPGDDRDALGRLVAAELLRAGYEVARSAGSVLTVVLPEPAEVEETVVPATVVEQPAPRQEVAGEFRQTEHGLRYLTADEVAAEDAASPAGEVAYRQVGEGLYEVVLDGQAAGRVARTTPAHVALARWSSYRTNGERIASGASTRADAGARVVEHARFATVDADTITNRRDLIAAVEVQTRRLGYASAAAYLQAPGREVTRARAEVAVENLDGPALPAVDDENACDRCRARFGSNLVGARWLCSPCDSIEGTERAARAAGCDCDAVPGRHAVHCDDCSAPRDRCVCDPTVGTLAPAERARVERLAARYGVTPAEVVRTSRAVVEEASAPAPRHWTREEVLDRLRATGGFDLTLGPDDTAPDLEVGDTMLGGVTLRYAYGEFPGTAYRTIVLGDEPAVDDDPREQPEPVEASSIARPGHVPASVPDAEVDDYLVWYPHPNA